MEAAHRAGVAATIEHNSRERHPKGCTCSPRSASAHRPRHPLQGGGCVSHELSPWAPRLLHQGGQAAQGSVLGGRGCRRRLSGQGEGMEGRRWEHGPPGGGQRSRLVPTLSVLCKWLRPPAAPTCELLQLDAPSQACAGTSRGQDRTPGCPGYHQTPLPMHPPGEAARSRSYRCRPTLGSSPVTWEPSG